MYTHFGRYTHYIDCVLLLVVTWASCQESHVLFIHWIQKSHLWEIMYMSSSNHHGSECLDISKDIKKYLPCVLFDKDKPHKAVCSTVRALQDFDSEVLVSANSGCAETVSVLLVKTVRGKYSIYILYSISHFAIVAHSTRSWKSLWAKWMAVSGVIFLAQEINMKFADGMRCPRSKKEHKIKSRFKNDPFCLCRIFITLSLLLGK